MHVLLALVWEPPHNVLLPNDQFAGFAVSGIEDEYTDVQYRDLFSPGAFTQVNGVQGTISGPISPSPFHQYRVEHTCIGVALCGKCEYRGWLKGPAG